MPLCRETGIVAALCAADLLSTLILLHHGGDEGNALMSFYLREGTWAFIIVKCLLFMPALVIAEWYRRRNPRLVAMTLRSVIALYVLFYTMGVVQFNRPAHAATPDPTPAVAPALARFPLPSPASGMERGRELQRR